MSGNHYFAGREFGKAWMQERGAAPDGGWIQAIEGREEELLGLAAEQVRYDRIGRLTSEARAALLEFALGASDAARSYAADLRRIQQGLAVGEAVAILAALILPLFFLMGV